MSSLPSCLAGSVVSLADDGARAERARREDRAPLSGGRRSQLERLLREYVDHYNRERLHRALGLRAPEPSPQVIPLRPGHQTTVRRRNRLGGLFHEYARAA